jgi:hypothetical protein
VDNVHILSKEIQPGNQFITLEFELELFFDDTTLQRQSDCLYLVNVGQNEHQGVALNELDRNFVYPICTS